MIFKIKKIFFSFNFPKVPHDPKISKANFGKTLQTIWNYLPRRYEILVLEKKSKIYSFFLFLLLGIFFFFSRKIRKIKRVYHKQYPDIAVVYRYTVWSMLWSMLFLYLFGGTIFFLLFFPKSGFDLVFILKSLSFFFSSYNVDTIIKEFIFFFKSQLKTAYIILINKKIGI